MKIITIETNPQVYPDIYDGTKTYEVTNKTTDVVVGDLVQFELVDFKEEHLPFLYGKEVLAKLKELESLGFKYEHKQVGATTRIRAWKRRTANEVYRCVSIQDIPGTNYRVIGVRRMEMI